MCNITLQNDIKNICFGFTFHGGFMKYTEDFENLWAIYPKRRPNNSKAKAFKAFNARLRQGYQYEDIKAGLERYIACKEAEGAIGTEFIMMAATFFGPDEHFTEDWEPPEKKEKPKKINPSDLIIPADWKQRGLHVGIRQAENEIYPHFRERVLHAESLQASYDL